MGEPKITWTDSRLIRECVRGNDRAWSALIAKYKGLIYSIPLKYGATPDDAADVFQSVCLELFAELPRLRKAAALRSWLITVAARQSLHWKTRRQRRGEQELTEIDEERADAEHAIPAALLEEIEREQLVREAVAHLPPRCQEIIKLLFYEEPPVAYRDLAQRLGLATGSIGFIRGRCLARLQRTLERLGF
ncbi:MAG TPA: sigma-70 family RNA polymerase sigma factor [Vicinamibacterales bacterium]|nr:sigma-70 family RNA polymerase sigma factor [Vicinamibacterales bacterium]